MVNYWFILLIDFEEEKRYINNLIVEKKKESEYDFKKKKEITSPKLSDSADDYNNLTANFTTFQNAASFSNNSPTNKDNLPHFRPLVPKASSKPINSFNDLDDFSECFQEDEFENLSFFANSPNTTNIILVKDFCLALYNEKTQKLIKVPCKIFRNTELFSIKHKLDQFIQNYIKKIKREEQQPVFRFPDEIKKSLEYSFDSFLISPNNNSNLLEFPPIYTFNSNDLLMNSFNYNANNNNNNMNSEQNLSNVLSSPMCRDLNSIRSFKHFEVDDNIKKAIFVQKNHPVFKPKIEEK